MSQTVQTFQLGSSTVVTLPKNLGIKPGQKLSIKKTGKRVTLQEEELNLEEARELVKKLSGGLNLKRGLTQEDLKAELDRRYDDMLPGR